MNLAEGRLERHDGRLVVRTGSIALVVPDGAIDRYPRVREYEGKNLAVGMRPEHFYRPDGSVPQSQRFSAKVGLVEALGSELLVHINTDAPPVLTEDTRQAIDDEAAFAELERTAAGGQSFTCRFEPGNPPRVGEQIDIAFRGEYLHFFDLGTGAALR